LLQEGSYTTLDVPASQYTEARGINNLGMIVGTYVGTKVRPPPAEGFLLDHGTYTTFDVPGAIYTGPAGINDSGTMVGQYADAQNNTHGFLYRHHIYTTLDVPGANVTIASGINLSGQIVGQYVDASGKSHGFLLQQGSYTTLECRARPLPVPTTSTPRGKSWESTRMLSAHTVFSPRPFRNWVANVTRRPDGWSLKPLR
jgi:uncharacterized membrane protein